MLSFALPSVVLLSIIAASQTGIQAGIGPSVSSPSQSPISICFGESPATAMLADSVLPTISPGFSGCAQENHLPIKLNQTAACVAATTSSDLPEAPGASGGGPNSADGTRDLSGTRFVPPTPPVGRNTTRSWHTLDTKFILLQTLSTVALLLDLETTAQAFEQQPKATELNPLFGAHPTRARLYGIAVPLSAFSFYLSYHYKKMEPSRSVWKVAPGLSIAIHTAAAINNLIVAHR
jgi:hypothetical protein